MSQHRTAQGKEVRVSLSLSLSLSLFVFGRTTIFSPKTSMANAVVPEHSSGREVHASPNSASVSRQASRMTSMGVSGKCSCDKMLSRSRFLAKVAAQMPPCPSKT